MPVSSRPLGGIGSRRLLQARSDLPTSCVWASSAPTEWCSKLLASGREEHSPEICEGGQAAGPAFHKCQPLRRQSKDASFHSWEKHWLLNRPLEKEVDRVVFLNMSKIKVACAPQSTGSKGIHATKLGRRSKRHSAAE